jgi:hypothetical protein
MQEYNLCDRQLHWLSQVLAKTNRTYIKKQKDDSHTNLYFDPIANKICGRWIESKKGKRILILNLNTLSFELIDDKLKSLLSVPVYNKSIEQLENEIASHLISMELDTNEFFKKLHFEIPDYKIDNISMNSISDRGLEKWRFYRELAGEACYELLGYLQSESEIRIWPHHFDTGIYTRVNKKLSLGFGLAMEDAMIGQPYFYMTGYSDESPINYKNIPLLSKGKWETGENWNGAVLPLSEMSNTSYSEADKTLRLFIVETSNWFLIQ